MHQPFRLKRNFFWDHLEFQPVPKEGLVDYYFDQANNREIFNRAARKCYLPANQILQEQIDTSKGEAKRVKVAFSLSGVWLEQCEMWNGDLLDSFRQLASTDCVEFLDQAYYHSLASLWPDRREWIEQIRMHQQAMKDILGVKPTFFENTEFLYNNVIAKTVEELGYKGIFTEGVDRVLGWRSPNYVYKPTGCERLSVLMRNYHLTDDFGFRFSARWWPEWPLTADKFAAWLATTPGQCINLFADYETFGEHHWPETGIHEFLRHLPQEILKYEQLTMATPTEVVERNTPVGEIDVSELGGTISWADLERDTSCWLGNTMQWAYYQEVRDLALLVKETQDEELTKTWRLLQSSDHLYYMFTAGGGPGEVHSYFSHYGSPYDAFATCLDVICDFRARVKENTISANAPLKLDTDGTVWSLKGLCEALKSLDHKSIEHHMQQGDIEKWIEEELKDAKLTKKITKISAEKLSGKELKDILTHAVLSRYQELAKLRRLELPPTKTKIREPTVASEFASRILRQLPSWRAFWFYTGVEESTGICAASLAEFCERIRHVDTGSVEFHNSRGDFECWVRDALHDLELAQGLRQIRESNLTGEELRNKIVEVSRGRHSKLISLASRKLDSLRGE